MFQVHFALIFFAFIPAGLPLSCSVSALIISRTKPGDQKPGGRVRDVDSPGSPKGSIAGNITVDGDKGFPRRV